MIIITGIGRSGTSFAASVLYEAGAPFKGDWFDESIKAGMEYGKVVELNNVLVKGQASSLDEAISVLGVPEIRTELADGVIVKDPRFTMTLDQWLAGGFKIEHIVYCARDYREIYDSSQKSGCGMGGDLGNGITIPSFDGFKNIFSYVERMFMATAKIHGIPVTTIEFPKSVKDFGEMEKLSFLAGRDSLKGAWEKSRRPGMVGSEAGRIAEPDDKQKLLEAYARLNQKEQKITELASQLALMEEQLRQKDAELGAAQAPWPKKMERAFRRSLLYPVMDLFKGKEMRRP